MKKFNAKFEKLMEDVTTTSALGPTQAHSAQVGKSGDFYAPGDARVPSLLGKKKKRNGKPAVIRRTFPTM